MLSLPGPVDPGWFSEQSLTYLDRMEEEHDNLRAALEWATAHDPARAVRLGLIMGDFWLSRDYNAEAETWCQTILRCSEGRSDQASERARICAVLTQAATFMGDHHIGRPAAAAGLALAEQAGDKVALAHLYGMLGLSCMYQGDFEASRQALKAGEALAREQDLKGPLALILILETQVRFFEGGNTAEAQEYWAETEALMSRPDTQASYKMLDFAFARLTGLLGNIAKARVLFNRTIEAAQRTGNLRVVYSCHSELAHMLRRHGDLDEALGLYAHVLPKWKDLGHRSAVAHELECIAFIQVLKDQPDTALTMLGAAESLRREVGSSMTVPERAEYDQVLAGLRSRVDENDFQRLWGAGHSMDMEQAVAFALAAVDPLH
jgi:non-specific serine/threonine protein kinase